MPTRLVNVTTKFYYFYQFLVNKQMVRLLYQGYTLVCIGLLGKVALTSLFDIQAFNIICFVQHKPYSKSTCF